MNLLLDTNVWLLGLLAPERIPPAIRSRLKSGAAGLWISPITVWEATWLAQKGRIRILGSPGDWARAAMASGPWREAPLTSEIAIQSRAQPIPVEDPADRFLVATAYVEGFTLVTSDRALAKIPGVSVLAFRPRA